MAHQPTALKILAIGSPLSALSTTVDKIAAINAKHGPFDACVLAGDVFKEESDGSEVAGISFPIPTYFTLGKYPLPESLQAKVSETGGEVVNNLVFLGKSAVLTTAQGLKIACVGGAFDQGLYDSGVDTGPYSPIISKPAVDAVLSHSLFNPSTSTAELSLASARQANAALPSAFQGVDLLLFSSPPPSLSLLSPSAGSLGFSLADNVPPFAEVVKKTRPRYMFWGEGEGFWEREPWGWQGSNGKDERWTRSVKLGSLGSEEPQGVKKARWFYAFTLPAQATGSALPVKPANATPNPFVIRDQAKDEANGRKRGPLDDQETAFGGDSAKRSKSDRGPPPDSYTCNICKMPGHWIQDCPQKTETDHSKPPPGYTCNICQSTEHFIRECPERASADRPRGPKPPPEGYVCRACGADGAHYIKDCPIVGQRDQERSKKKELGPAECWFCLSNPKVTKHLITAIGQETYVTLPKGQLIPTTPAHIAQGGSKPLVPGGGHVLIIPIAHHPTLLSIPADDAMNIIAELESYKASLRSCYAAYGAVPVTFEVGRLSGRGGHAHVQIVPIPKDLSSKVAESFKLAGEKQGLDWEEDPEKALSRLGSNGNYFKVECPDGTKMVHLLKGNFDLQFGRMVLASLLGLHHRIDWKDCSQSEKEEKEDAQKFKKAFAPYHA